MNEEEEIILVNDVSLGLTGSTLGKGGMRRLHVTRVGTPVEAETWLEKIPTQSRSQAGWVSWVVGTAVKRYHLSMWWPCRGVVQFQSADGGRWTGVMWKGIEGDSFAETLLAAMLEFREATEADPKAAMVRPEECAQDVIQIGGWEDMRVTAVEWMPKRCVIVY